MQVVIAVDSFKGSLTSLQAGAAVREAVLRADPRAGALVFPIADGGEGTAVALSEGMGGRMREITVHDPLMRPVAARYGITPEKTAVIEMAAAAGLPLLKKEERDPLTATTFGVGEMILDALAQGYRRFIIGIGGSATNDGGCGMLRALGFSFLDASGQPVPDGAQGLGRIAKIDKENVAPELKESVFRVACDVTNPLCGTNGCSLVFAPQKGASREECLQMDANMALFARAAKQVNPDADPDEPGGGAAGGMGFALRTFLSASLEKGIEIVMKETRLEEAVRAADVVVTGEGRLDGQSMMGKAPVGVAALAKKYGKPVIAFAGCVADDAVLCNEKGIDAFFPILRAASTLEQAMEKSNAYRNLTETAYQAFRLYLTAQNRKGEL